MNIYHEKQSKQLCALHALNNLFQDPNAFTKNGLDQICYKLSPSRFMNPHKSSLGLGNYDINVIMSALSSKNCEAIWFDKRKDPECLDFQSIKGFILNIPNPSCKQWTFNSFIFLPTNILSSRKHWITIRSLNDGNYYNFDSKLEAPQLIGKENELINFLREKNKSSDTEIFVVIDHNINHELMNNCNGEQSK